MILREIIAACPVALPKWNKPPIEPDMPNFFQTSLHPMNREYLSHDSFWNDLSYWQSVPQQQEAFRRGFALLITEISNHFFRHLVQVFLNNELQA